MGHPRVAGVHPPARRQRRTVHLHPQAAIAGHRRHGGDGGMGRHGIHPADPPARGTDRQGTPAGRNDGRHPRRPASAGLVAEDGGGHGPRGRSGPLQPDGAGGIQRRPGQGPSRCRGDGADAPTRCLRAGMERGWPARQRRGPRRARTGAPAGILAGTAQIDLFPGGAEHQRRRRVTHFRRRKVAVAPGPRRPAHGRPPAARGGGAAAPSFRSARLRPIPACPACSTVSTAGAASRR